MKRLRWQLLIVALALGAIGVLLLVDRPTDVGPDELPEAVPGGIYTEGLIGSMSRLNPVLDFYSPADRDVNRLLFSSLFQSDSRGLHMPDLAETWGVSLDRRVYNVYLRQNAVWHDGEPVTTDDFLFTLELLKDPALPLPADWRTLWENIEVEAFDEFTLQFRLSEPFAPFLDYLTFGILPEHLLGDMSPEEIIDAPYNLAPVGSGPYRFEQLLVEDGQITGVDLAAFEDYHQGRSLIDRVVFLYFPDSASALEAYREGEIDGISHITPDVLAEAMQEPDLNLHTGRLPQLSLIFLNLDNARTPFFQDKTVRQALLLGLNRQRMIDQDMGGQAIAAHSPIFPGTWAYYDGVEQYAYDPETAKEMLRSAGYTVPAEGGRVRTNEGQRLEFDMVYLEGSALEPIAEAAKRDWAEIGVRVNLVAVASYEELVEEYLDTRQYEAALVELDLSRTPDPDPYPFWHQTQITGGQNYSMWDDRRASEYLEQARITLDLRERERLYRSFQVHFSRELPSLPLFYPVYTYGVDSRVQGVSMGPLFDPSDRLLTFTSWFLVTGGPSEETATPSP